MRSDECQRCYGTGRVMSVHTMSRWQPCRRCCFWAWFRNLFTEDFI